MNKIGRNDQCPCGSGMKYKKCCLVSRKGPSDQSASPSGIPSVRQEVEKIQETAKSGREVVRPLGVFILTSTRSGDAWLLEATDMDGVQVAAAGAPISIEINEGPETIEINWTHRFSFRGKKFITVAYKDNAEEVRENYPAQAIHATFSKIMKKIPPELLNNIHITEDTAAAADAPAAP